jgi:hypothetical protein
MPFGWVHQLPTGPCFFVMENSEARTAQRIPKQNISGQEVNNIGLPAPASNGGET